jgi:hypothetical protein
MERPPQSETARLVVSAAQMVVHVLKGHDQGTGVPFRVGGEAAEKMLREGKKCQGPTLVVPQTAQNELGFSP